TSAAVRITPVPKPPTPPTTAAASASAATAASVGASRSKLGAGGHRARAPFAVDRHVGERRLGDLHDRRIGRPALGVDLHGDGDGGPAYAHELGVEGKHVADLLGLLEDELLHRDRGDAPAGNAPGDDAARDVDLRHDPAAEDVAVL